jgi:hypothetical protein
MNFSKFNSKNYLFFRKQGATLIVLQQQRVTGQRSTGQSISAGPASHPKRSTTHYDLQKTLQALGSCPSTDQSEMGDYWSISLSLGC